jgi:hypothetical protein
MRTARKDLMKTGLAFLMLFMLLQADTSLAQSPTAKKKILVNMSHVQKFHNDPADMNGKDSLFVECIKYMTG